MAVQDRPRQLILAPMESVCTPSSEGRKLIRPRPTQVITFELTQPIRPLYINASGRRTGDGRTDGRLIAIPRFALRETRVEKLTFQPFSFYRAMHRYCYHNSSVCLSVSPSVRPSVTLMCHGRIGRVGSKVISLQEYLAQGLRSSEPQRRRSSPRGTSPKFG